MAGWGLTYEEAIEQWSLDPRLLAAYRAMEKEFYRIMQDIAVSVSPEITKATINALTKPNNWSGFWDNSEVGQLAESALKAKLNSNVFVSPSKPKSGGKSNA